MNGFSRNSRNAQVWCYQKAGAGLSGWKSGILEGKPLSHGSRPPVLLPGQPGSSLPGKGLNSATCAAGAGGNKKSSLLRPGGGG